MTSQRYLKYFIANFCASSFMLNELFNAKCFILKALFNAKCFILNALFNANCFVLNAETVDEIESYFYPKSFFVYNVSRRCWWWSDWWQTWARNCYWNLDWKRSHLYTWITLKGCISATVGRKAEAAASLVCEVFTQACPRPKWHLIRQSKSESALENNSNLNQVRMNPPVIRIKRAWIRLWS